MDSWYLDNLVCPRDHQELGALDESLVCPQGHRFPVIDGMPVMLLDDAQQTMELASTSLRQAHARRNGMENEGPLYLESVGVSDEERRGIAELASRGDLQVDPVVSYLISATNGIAYKHLIGKLQAYPIPELRLPQGDG